jgi:hypothetical protein
MTSPSDQDKSRAEAAEIEREMTVMRREEARNQTGQSVRRLVLTVITTALVALALWMAMR